MKTASIILTIIGMIGNFLTYFIYQTEIQLIFAIIGVVVGIITLISLGSDKKIVAIGVLAIIFAGLLGGIFYLCWKPNEKAMKINDKDVDVESLNPFDK